MGIASIIREAKGTDKIGKVISSPTPTTISQPRSGGGGIATVDIGKGKQATTGDIELTAKERELISKGILKKIERVSGEVITVGETGKVISQDPTAGDVVRSIRQAETSKGSPLTAGEAVGIALEASPAARKIEEKISKEPEPTVTPVGQPTTQPPYKAVENEVIEVTPGQYVDLEVSGLLRDIDFTQPKAVKSDAKKISEAFARGAAGGGIKGILGGFFEAGKETAKNIKQVPKEAIKTPGEFAKYQLESVKEGGKEAVKELIDIGKAGWDIVTKQLKQSGFVTTPVPVPIMDPTNKEFTRNLKSAFNVLKGKTLSTGRIVGRMIALPYNPKDKAIINDFVKKYRDNPELALQQLESSRKKAETVVKGVAGVALVTAGKVGEEELRQFLNNPTKKIVKEGILLFGLEALLKGAGKVAEYTKGKKLKITKLKSVAISESKVGLKSDKILKQLRFTTETTTKTLPSKIEQLLKGTNVAIPKVQSKIGLDWVGFKYSGIPGQIGKREVSRIRQIMKIDLDNKVANVVKKITTKVTNPKEIGDVLTRYVKDLTKYGNIKKLVAKSKGTINQQTFIKLLVDEMKPGKQANTILKQIFVGRPVTQKSVNKLLNVLRKGKRPKIIQTYQLISDLAGGFEPLKKPIPKVTRLLKRPAYRKAFEKKQLIARTKLAFKKILSKPPLIDVDEALNLKRWQDKEFVRRFRYALQQEKKRAFLKTTKKAVLGFLKRVNKAIKSVGRNKRLLKELRAMQKDAIKRLLSKPEPIRGVTSNTKIKARRFSKKGAISINREQLGKLNKQVKGTATILQEEYVPVSAMEKRARTILKVEEIVRPVKTVSTLKALFAGIALPRVFNAIKIFKRGQGVNSIRVSANVFKSPFTKQKLKIINQVINKLGYEPVTKLGYEPVTNIEMAVQPAYKQIPLTGLGFEQIPAQEQQITPRLSVKPIPKPVQKPKPIKPINVKFDPIPPPERIKIPELPDKRYKSIPRKIVGGWNTYIIERGKVTKANIFPLPYNQADKLGKDITDNSVSASYRVTKTKLRVPSSRRRILSTGKPVMASKFSKGKSTRLSKYNVEKNKNRIDSKGEKEGLRAARLIKQLRMNNSNSILNKLNFKVVA